MPAALLTLLLLSQAEAPAFSQEELDFFEKRVRPILASRCYECHSATSEKPRAELYLDHREGILKGGETGPAAIPGDAAQSRLLAAVRYNDEDLQMPPAGKMPDEEIAILDDWIRRGLPFPKTASVAMAKKTIDIEAGRKHWAFQPVKQAASLFESQSGSLSYANGKIDAFILSQLREKNLAPSATSDRRTLIRRAKFDLLGLPPTPEEIEEFANDEASDAYSTLVDRYLASPHYGERWGRFWLDLARYCDVPEAWQESKAKAWLYRDWVVRAFNDDLPYDQFVRQQLAADLLPAAKPEDNAALGFLGLSPMYWKELKLDHNMIKQVVAEEWEERIEAIGATFLGLTTACARCHDHKFDPITQHDYYALAGVLASIRLDDRPVIAADLAATAKAARDKVAGLQKQLDELKKVKEPSEEQKQQLAALPSQIEELQKTPYFDSPLAFGVSDASIVVEPEGEHRTKIHYRDGQAQNVAVHIRGMAANSGPVVPRRFLSVLTAEPKPFEQGSGRRELAEAIVTDSAPLAARVIVNRVWRHHFGRGIVNTPSNFGTQGETPSHPELLDDLAARFINSGWSLKWLHREIMLSATYQQSSQRDPARHAIDPDNVLLWRMTPRRLEVEAWRDAVLSVTGEIDDAVGGESIELSDAANRRRTIYGRVKRRELSDLLRLHDFPDPVNHSASREATITPLQQLFVLNGPFLHDRAAVLVTRMHREAPSDVDARVTWLYPLLFGRAATPDDLGSARNYFDGAGESDETWRTYAHALLSSNEFLFID